MSDEESHDHDMGPGEKAAADPAPQSGSDISSASAPPAQPVQSVRQRIHEDLFGDDDDDDEDEDDSDGDESQRHREKEFLGFGPTAVLDDGDASYHEASLSTASASAAATTAAAAEAAAAVPAPKGQAVRKRKRGKASTVTLSGEQYDSDGSNISSGSGSGSDSDSSSDDSDSDSESDSDDGDDYDAGGSKSKKKKAAAAKKKAEKKQKSVAKKKKTVSEAESKGPRAKRARGDGVDKEKSEFQQTIQKMKSETRRRKKLSEGDREDLAKSAKELVERMDKAHREDEKQRRLGRASTLRLKLLPEVSRALIMPLMHVPLIRAEVLASLAKWLSPVEPSVVVDAAKAKGTATTEEEADRQEEEAEKAHAEKIKKMSALERLRYKQLPLLSVRETLLPLIEQLHVLNAKKSLPSGEAKDLLKASGLGKVMVALVQHPRETRDNRAIALRIVSEWERIIMNRQTTYRGTDADMADQEADAAAAQSHAQKRTKVQQRSVSATKVHTPVSLPTELPQPGTKEYRPHATLPGVVRHDFSVTPKVADDYHKAAKQALPQLKRSILSSIAANKRKSGKK